MHEQQSSHAASLQAPVALQARAQVSALERSSLSPSSAVFASTAEIGRCACALLLSEKTSATRFETWSTSSASSNSELERRVVVPFRPPSHAAATLT